MTDYKKMIADNIVIDGAGADEIYSLLCYPVDAAMGDYSLPCFKFAKALRKAPVQIAAAVADDFNAKSSDCVAEAVSGYVNFRLNREIFVREAVTECMARGEEFAPAESNGKTVCLDYSSINIAKPFHIGHLLTTVIGGSLYRIFKFLGYNAVGINHLGDWGTQFGKLISAYKRWGDERDVEERGINALLELYVKFHEEAEKNEELNEEGRAWFKKIESGDKEALDIFSRFKEVTLRDVEKIYQRLGIKFDSYNGESFYNDKLADVVSELNEKGLLTESDGAKVVDLEKYGMPPCLILKSDGASLYATRDLAAAKYRKKTYGFDKSLYVVAYQQNLHFAQVFKVLELMGYEWAKDCVHVPFGMVSLENAGALSTRKGNVVFLKDVLDTAVEKTAKIIEEKNPALKDKQKTADVVGVGAVVFGALSTSRIKDMVFSYDKALNFDGETAPYIQYTHARCCSILNKSCGDFGLKVDYSALCDDESYAVVKLLSRFDETVSAAAEKYEPSIIARYLIDLAQSFNKFYISHRVSGDKARTALTYCVKNVLKNGLNLILIGAPESM